MLKSDRIGQSQPKEILLGSKDSKGPSNIITSMLATARKAAIKAGEIQIDHFNRGVQRVLEEKDHDLKIEVDRLSEEIIYHIIRKQFPEHAIISEEGDYKYNGSDHIWIVDPLDGTVNYYFGIPFFCVCIACYRVIPEIETPKENSYRFSLDQAQPLIGVVYAPFFDRMYCAATGYGAICNERSIELSPGHGLGEAIIGISFGSDEATIQQMEAVNALLVRRVKKIRILGATGLDLVQVAMGSLSCVIQLNVRIWDFAAGRIILEESGGAFEAHERGQGGWRILASSRSLFQPIKAILHEALG